MADQLLVPRELLERLDFGKDTARALQALPELRALLAQPASEPKPVEDGEPRLVSYSTEMATCTLNHEGREYYFVLDCKSDEAHPAPAGVIQLPERRIVRDSETILQWHKDWEWNACLDEVARLNGVKQ